ncbi:unnamed protein product, partial [marine sediment metagenome]
MKIKPREPSKMENLDTGEKDIRKFRERIIAANVYIGSE